VFEVFHSTTPLVEGLSIDEAFLDVGGLRRIAGSPEVIAARLRVEVAERVGLPITVGVARTKFLAKVASRVAKPDGLLVVAPERELEFLHPLPVQLLWGVGPVTAGKLHEVGVRTVGEVAALSESTLVTLVGAAAGRQLHALSHNRDARRVRPGVRRRSIGSQRALGRRERGGAAGPPAAEVDAILVGLVDRVTRRMRAAGRPGRTVVLRLRFADFTRATRSHTLAEATDSTGLILAAARALLSGAAAMISERGLTLVGVAVGNLGGRGGADGGPDGTAGAVQLPLPLGGVPSAALDGAMDQVKDRFGTTALTRGVLLGRDQGWEMPMLPD
jgi:DNA polymerase-4